MLSSKKIPSAQGIDFRYVEIMETQHPFEIAFVDYVASRVESSEMSHSEFGRRVLGEKSGSRLWRCCRHGTPQRRFISVSEAHVMAEILGEEFPSLIWKISQWLDERQKTRK